MQLGRIYPGVRIETIERKIEKTLKEDSKDIAFAKTKVLEAQKEMEEFTKFLKEKYLKEGSK